MDNMACDGVMYKGINLVPCTRKPHHTTEELLHYCDVCIRVYDAGRNYVEPPYNPDEYDGYIPTEGT